MQTTSSLSCSRVERAEVHRFSIRSTSALETRRRRSKFRFDRWIVYDNGTQEERKHENFLELLERSSSSSFAREDVSRSKWNNWYRLRMLTKTREWGMRFARKKWKVEEGGQLILESIANGWRWSNFKNLNGRWRLATFGLRARYEHGPMRTERKGIGSYARPRGTGTYGRHFWSFR